MKRSLPALLALVAALSLIAADGAAARGKGGSGGGRSAHSGGRHHSHHHARTAAFVGGFATAPLWPWWAYAVYAESAGPMHYVERAQEGQGEWLYCSGAGAYFPYVPECPGGWQSVRPPPAPG